MSELFFDSLPELPQVETLRRIVPVIWRHDEVVAVWVGGSFASGAADICSDVDLRVAVRTEWLSAWKHPDLAATFDVSPVVGGNTRDFGDGVLHHLVLANGEIYDLFVQGVDRELTVEPRVLLGCRDDRFASRLNSAPSNPAAPAPAAEGSTIQQLITDFWINSHKHRKVLHRGLDIVLLTGLHNDRSVLTRLWCVLSTGCDVGGQAPTIHSLTAIGRAVDELIGPDSLKVVGGSMADRDAICQAVEQIRDEVSRVGRILAERLEFDYPESLEDTVRKGWDAFRAEGTVDERIG